MTQEESRKQYIEYINEHISNVKKAYDKYGKMICDKLDMPYYKLEFAVACHDSSKMQKDEFNGYRQYFYTADDEEKNKELFDLAWNHHAKSNKHHPEYWVLIDNEVEGKIKILDMDDLSIAEMLLDWAVMSIKFKSSAKEYYYNNRDSKFLSENTKKKVDELIELFD